MSNSPLVSYTKISPNRTRNRNHKIDMVVIHCVVGQVSIESLGNHFAQSSVGASSNYGIGTDGRIGMFVEEKDRAWATGGVDRNGKSIRVNGISGADIDQRAISIECACDSSHPYAINQKVYVSLIKLLADICQRNGIKELKWQGNKNLVGQVDKQNMAVHRWFAYKACPGDYIYNLHPQIAKEVNARLREQEDEDMIRYNSLAEMPEYYRTEAQKLIDAGALKGNDGKLNISEDMIRGAIIGMRYHDAQDPHYDSIDDMPTGYRAEAQKLIDRGALRGKSDGKLDITESMLRAMIICQRMIDAK